MMDLLEVRLPDKESFLKVKETLERIGIASNKRKTLWPSCVILHKRGQYYIAHFKEMLSLDGKSSTMNEDDLSRRNRIAALLQEWGLVEIVSPINGPMANVSSIKILSFSDKDNWTIVPKYTIGKKGKH